MRSELSLGTRAENTAKYARAYQQASTKTKWEVHDQVVTVQTVLTCTALSLYSSLVTEWRWLRDANLEIS